MRWVIKHPASLSYAAVGQMDADNRRQISIITIKLKEMHSESNTRYLLLATAAIGLAIGFGLFIWKTYTDLLPIPDSLNLEASAVRKVQVLDRNDIPLTITYQNRWNIHDYVPLHEIPIFLQQAIIISEDKRFYKHSGVDWIARWHALWQNLKALGKMRGASTISEQVVRMWHPRARTAWSRWLEGLEAAHLEVRFSKADIFEFYLNQVPYAGRRRGVAQAARYYFDRDLDTLSRKEMLALVVLVRAPGRLDLRRSAREIQQPIRDLLIRLYKMGIVDEAQYAQIHADKIQLEKSYLAVRASHFVHHLFQSLDVIDMQHRVRLRTTLDAPLQAKIQNILQQRLKDLQRWRVSNGAVLVVDHLHQQVLAWANASQEEDSMSLSWIDAVTAQRQPGSTLKPFLYATAMEKGWTAATPVDDHPLAEPIGYGLHTFRNYSRIHYGPLLVRDALGNSLNVPAVQAIRYVGVDTFLNRLHDLGIQSLHRHPDYYGDGLALGNGEVTLLELVQAYTVLAAQGVYRPLKFLIDDGLSSLGLRRVFSPEVASLIGNILSDPNARSLEFGEGSLLRLPVQTAVKTGTSNDYRDAWAIGFNHRYTVGVWMGNLDHRSMDGITGSSGPALVLRSVFAELNRYRLTHPLYLSPRLVQIEICRDTGSPANDHCSSYLEWFIPGTEPGARKPIHHFQKSLHLIQPTNGLQLAMDPRIPNDQEAFCFKLAKISGVEAVDWYVDDQFLVTTSTGEYLWPLQPGMHRVGARVWLEHRRHPVLISPVKFIVK
ncbi:MAG: transglycosylase domain-containing protein [Desulfobacteraceae bacterium]